MRRSHIQCFLYTFLGSIIILINFGCNSRANESVEQISNLTTSKVSKSILNTLPIELVKLDTIETSFLGRINIKNNTIQFFDKKFNNISSFDLNGKYIERFLGQGGGPNE